MSFKINQLSIVRTDKSHIPSLHKGEIKGELPQKRLFHTYCGHIEAVRQSFPLDSHAGIDGGHLGDDGFM